MKKSVAFLYVFVGPGLISATNIFPAAILSMIQDVSFQLHKTGPLWAFILQYFINWNTPFTNGFPNNKPIHLLQKISVKTAIQLSAFASFFLWNLHHRPEKKKNTHTQITPKPPGGKTPTMYHHAPPPRGATWRRPCSSALRAATLPRSRVGANFGPQGLRDCHRTGWTSCLGEVCVCFFCSPKKTTGNDAPVVHLKQHSPKKTYDIDVQ